VGGVSDEHDAKRSIRETSRAAIDAAVTPTIGTSIFLLKVIAHDESQVLEVLRDPKLPMRETRIDRLARPLEPWNTRPTIAERNALADAQKQHRLEVEAAIDRELRMLRTQRLAEAGI